MTPGKFRAHAQFLRHGASEYRRMATQHEVMPFWRKKWLADADRMDESADWYDQAASRREITVEYTVMESHKEAAE